MIQPLKIPKYNDGEKTFSLYGDEQVYGKINELIEELNNIKNIIKPSSP